MLLPVAGLPSTNTNGKVIIIIYNSVSEILKTKLWPFGRLQGDGGGLKLKVLISGGRENYHYSHKIVSKRDIT